MQGVFAFGILFSDTTGYRSKLLTFPGFAIGTWLLVPGATSQATLAICLRP